ncbi:hypothetical protein HanPSC8_Chr04g0180331 [Helianthus annuus]|nr:hypothetical protein HanPSC8_Chr04g0180331 [Helianthus annuus]
MNLEESPAPAMVFSCNFIWVFKLTDGFSSSTAYIKFANDDVSKFLESPATFSGKGILMEKIEAPLKEINRIKRMVKTAKKDLFLFSIGLMFEDVMVLCDSWFCVYGFGIVGKVNSRRV